MEKKNSTKKTVTSRKIKTKSEEVEVIKDEIFEKQTKRKFYYGFGQRFFTNIIFLILFSVLFVFSFVMSFAITKKEVINYKEKSNIDYKIYLKDNSFYDEEYLGKGMVYIASLIDNIHIDFGYYFDVDKLSNLDVDYSIKAKLTVASQQNSSVFFSKDYDLTKVTKEEVINKNNYYVDVKDVFIDYNYYNNLANDFKSKYAVNTDSKLEIYLEVNEKSKEDNSYDFINKGKVGLVIPLSQQEVNITFDNEDLDVQNQIINKPRIVIKDGKYLIMTIIVFILFIITLISLLNKISVAFSSGSSKYDRLINRILKGYDRLIVNIKTAPKFDDYNIIEVDSFQELIDVRDNISEPINYYVITPHQKCEFFVINNKNLYLYVVKSADLDNK